MIAKKKLYYKIIEKLLSTALRTGGEARMFQMQNIIRHAELVSASIHY